MTEPLEISRTVVIRAPRATVFRFFTDSERFARWWGKGSAIDAVPGGAVRICFPGGNTASGEVLEIEPEARIAFSYGYDDPAQPIAPGGSRVTVALSDHPEGTRLDLVHAVDGEAARAAHVQAWRYQLSVFAVVAAAEAHAEAAPRIDALLSAWGEPEAGRRRDLLEESVTDDVEFRDAFSCTRGREDLEAHAAAAALHMPGVRLHRVGEVRVCQGAALVEWEARDEQGASRGTGRNVYSLAPDGRIRSAVGFWNR